MHYHPPTPPLYLCGLDLGQTKDYTALAVIERNTDPIPYPEPSEKWPPSPPPAPLHRYAIRHLERFKLGTSYPAICDRVVELCATPPMIGCMLAVDETGVGRPVVDMLRRADPRADLRPITITSGSGYSGSTGGGWHVAKQQLVSVLQVLFQSHRLTIAQNLREAPALVRELEMFRVKISLSANESFEAWRVRDHDDLVLAVAMACWVGERGRREAKIF